jgi:hypothetical protein
MQVRVKHMPCDVYRVDKEHGKLTIEQDVCLAEGMSVAELQTALEPLLADCVSDNRFKAALAVLDETAPGAYREADELQTAIVLCTDARTAVQQHLSLRRVALFKVSDHQRAAKHIHQTALKILSCVNTKVSSTCTNSIITRSMLSDFLCVIMAVESHYGALRSAYVFSRMCLCTLLILDAQLSMSTGKS